MSKTSKWSKVLFVLLAGAFFFSFHTSPEKTSSLTVDFDNIRNNEGQLYIFIYSYENQYPENPYLHFSIDKSKRNSSGTLKFRIPDFLEKGNYAISVIDDENKNDDLDLFLGLPMEGYAFSNDVVPFFSMPDYEDLLFEVNQKHQSIKITLQYLL